MNQINVLQTIWAVTQLLHQLEVISLRFLRKTSVLLKNIHFIIHLYKQQLSPAPTALQNETTKPVEVKEVIH